MLFLYLDVDIKQIIMVVHCLNYSVCYTDSNCSVSESTPRPVCAGTAPTPEPSWPWHWHPAIHQPCSLMDLAAAVDSHILRAGKKTCWHEKCQNLANFILLVTCDIQQEDISPAIYLPNLSVLCVMQTLMWPFIPLIKVLKPSLNIQCYTIMSPPSSI